MVRCYFIPYNVFYNLILCFSKLNTLCGAFYSSIKLISFSRFSIFCWPKLTNIYCSNNFQNNQVIIKLIFKQYRPLNTL